MSYADPYLLNVKNKYGSTALQQQLAKNQARRESYQPQQEYDTNPYYHQQMSYPEKKPEMNLNSIAMYVKQAMGMNRPSKKEHYSHDGRAPKRYTKSEMIKYIDDAIMYYAPNGSMDYGLSHSEYEELTYNVKMMITQYYNKGSISYQQMEELSSYSRAMIQGKFPKHQEEYPMYEDVAGKLTLTDIKNEMRYTNSQKDVASDYVFAGNYDNPDSHDGHQNYSQLMRYQLQETKYYGGAPSGIKIRRSYQK